MKKIILSLAAAALVFVSCDNENAVNPEPQGIVTIKGTVYSDLDEDDADNPVYESIPADVTIYFSDDDTNAPIAQTKTNANGEYSIDLPIGNRVLNVQIVVGDFNATVRDEVAVDDFEVKPALYNLRESALVSNATKGGVYIENIEISQPSFNNFD